MPAPPLLRRDYGACGQARLTELADLPHESAGLLRRAEHIAKVFVTLLATWRTRLGQL